MDSDKDTATSQWRSVPGCSAKYSTEEDIAICQDVVMSQKPKNRKKKGKELERKTGKRTSDARWEGISTRAESVREEFVKSTLAIENMGKLLSKQMIEYRRLEDLGKAKERLFKMEIDTMQMKQDRMQMEIDRMKMEKKNVRKNDRLDIHCLRTEYQLSDEQLQAHEDEIMFMDTSKLNPSQLECITASRIQIARDHGIDVSSIR